MDDEWVETIRKNDEIEKQKLINAGIETGIKTGIKTGIRTGGKNKLHEIIKNMLTLNESEQKIMLYTKAKKSEIEKVRKELQAQN